MSWTDLGVASALAGAFLLAPGLVIGWVAQVRGFVLVALAPALSTTAIAVGAIAAGILGVRWSWWAPLVTAAILSCVVWLALGVVRRAGLDVRRSSSPRQGWKRDLPLWLGLLVSSVLLGRQLTVVLGRPDAFSQTFDNIFHMAAVRYAFETGNASSLTISGVTRLEGDPTFYPAAFHALASLVWTHGPDDIAVAVNAAAAVISALVWPLGCLALVRLALPESTAGVLGAAVLLTSFSTFPVLLLDFGVLYPNLYGLALVPGMYGLLAQLLGLHSEQHVHPVVAALLLAVMAPGLVLAHPNALMVVVAIALAPFAAWFVRRWRTEWSSHRRPNVLGGIIMVFGIVVALSLIAWQVVRPPNAAATWPPIVSAPQAVGEALLNASPGGGRAAWLVSVLVVAGIVVAVRTGRWWLVGSWATVLGLWVVVAAFGPSDLRLYLTGIWYSDPWRFSAAIPLMAFPLGALGIHSTGQQLTVKVQSLTTQLGRNTTNPVGKHVLAQAVPALAVAVLVLGTQAASYMTVSLAGASTSYSLTAESPLVTRNEYALLMRTPGLVENGVVATNPWNGSSMLYPLTGVRTTNTHTLYAATDDQVILRNELDNIGSSSAACEAAQRMGVTHALDFGTQEVNGGLNPYPGLLDFANATGFREVDREGSAALYELTLCR